MSENILEGLNDAQRRAATAVRGPVCILAGAGTGKTTTITRRIAYQVASGAFPSSEILAVTFTERAAAEMRTRLRSLGVGGVRAKTFHAEALAQLAALDAPPTLLDAKGRLVAPLVRALPPPHKFRATRDVAAEIERAKNRRVTPERYLDDVGDHEPPVPPDLMARVYAEYEKRKQRANLVDFEDLLELTIRVLVDRPDAAARVASRYSAFTVDEYQDVNMLQQTLLEAWLQGRDEVCVVGDDYQSIFGFTGASPGPLLSFPSRFPGAQVVVLEESYRSTPEVLTLANKLGSRLGGTPKQLRASLPSGAEPVIKEYSDEASETSAIATRVRELIGSGVAAEEIAILYRINARAEDYEEALGDAGIPFQVRDSPFLRRPGPRAVLARLQRVDPSAPAAAAVDEAARAAGWAGDGDAGPGEEEATRQADLDRLVRLSAGMPGATVAAFVEDVRARFDPTAGGRGVVLSTYHRAKGLEFDAVLMPRLEERELPFALSKSDDAVAEERRLLYVGVTRARQHLFLTWAASRDGKRVRPSRFVEELLPVRRAEPRVARVETVDDPDLFARLRAWRARAAATAGVPAYVVFHDATLRAISDRRPATLVELSRVSGVGPTKLARYGSDVLDVVRTEL